MAGHVREMPGSSPGMTVPVMPDLVPLSSWPGLTRPSAGSSELVVKVAPLPNVVMALRPDQSLQAITLGKAVRQSLPMLPGTSSEIAGDPDVEGSVRPVCYHVDPAAVHGVVDPGNIRNRRRDGR